MDRHWTIEMGIICLNTSAEANQTAFKVVSQESGQSTRYIQTAECYCVSKRDSVDGAQKRGVKEARHKSPHCVAPLFQVQELVASFLC